MKPGRLSVIVAGAGLGGSLVAMLLAQRGHRVRIFERRSDPRGAGFIGGRSINLALSARGLAALDRAGLAQRVLAEAIRMPGRMLHSVENELAYQPYSHDPADAINSVSRGGLNLLLLNAAAELDATFGSGDGDIEFTFDARCVDVDLERPSITVRDEHTGEVSTHEADILVGADGAFSAVRAAMQRTPRFNYSQSYLEHGYKELHIPPAAECGVDPEAFEGFAMDSGALHIWPRGGSMMIALPNRDLSFTCTLFWPYESAVDGSGASFESVAALDDVRPFFNEWYGDAAAIMPTLEEDYRANPTSDLVTVRCSPWVRGRTCLLGDAAHAIVPFYGQGMNAAFEDCVALVDALDAHADPLAAMQAYRFEREPNAEAIADLALENFIEMRDKVADPEFQHRKRIEQTLHDLFPDRVRPLYNLVSFSTVPYDEARRIGRELAGKVARISSSLPREQAGTMPADAFVERVRTLGVEVGV